MCEKPILVLDLDMTLFYSKKKKNGGFHTTARPHLMSFLKQVSPYYKLVVFTMATRPYAMEKCAETGILPYVADEDEERIFTYEDALVVDGNPRKSLDVALCKKCQEHACIVDDTPDIWTDTSCTWFCTHYNPRKKHDMVSCMRPRTVYRIERFRGKTSRDQCLQSMSRFLVDHRNDLT
jgi:hypothetical protein